MEVAQALGLSTYTVSRALNGHTDVSQATRERVVDAARKMNYSASAMGATLRKGRTDTLCLMLTPSPGTLIDSYFLPVITGLDRILNPAGYSILIAGAASDAQESNLLRRMVEGRRADVVVLTRVRRDDSRARELRKLNFPFAMLGRDADDPASPFVDVDHYAMAVTATRWLIDRGHSRIALVNTPKQVHASSQIYEGWADTLRAVNLGPHPECAREGNYTAVDGRHAAESLLNLDPRPTAILCGNDYLGFGIMEAARARALRIGHDISIIGCDDIPLAAFATPPLSTFQTSMPEFGEMLAKQVLTLVKGEDPPSHLIIPTFVDRGSAGPAP